MTAIVTTPCQRTLATERSRLPPHFTCQVTQDEIDCGKVVIDVSVSATDSQSVDVYAETTTWVLLDRKSVLYLGECPGKTLPAGHMFTKTITHR